MSLKPFIHLLSVKEKVGLIAATGLFVASAITNSTLTIQEQSILIPVTGGVYKEGIVGQPIAINPVISANPVDRDISALIYSSISSLTTNIESGSENPLYTVKIEEGLKWSNEQPLTSDDIIFTIETIQNPEAGSPLYKNWEGVITERISELQVQFTLPGRYSFFEENLQNTRVIPKHIFGTIPPANLKLSTYNLEPIGSGPYKLHSISKRKDGFITDYRLAINENFNSVPPFIEEVHIKFFETKAESYRALAQKEIDGFGDLDAPPQTITQSVSTHVIPMARYYAIFFNPNINPFLKDKNLRVALRDAISPNHVIQEVFGNNAVAKPIQSPIIKSSNSANITAPTPEELSSISSTISQIKRSETLSLTLVVPQIDFLEKTAKIIQQSWQKIGVDELNIISLPLSDLLENVIEPNNYEMLLFGNIVEKPKDIFPFWHSSERFYPGLNLALYKSGNADTLMERIRQTDDSEKREEYLTELENTIIEDAPATLLYTLPYTYTHSDKLGGFKPPRSLITAPHQRFHNITEWYIETARVIEE
jgi:peptide/nickel transport system substrate-binding protein